MLCREAWSGHSTRLKTPRGGVRWLAVDSNLRSRDGRPRNYFADNGETLATLLGSNYVTRFGAAGRGYQIIPQAPEVTQLSRTNITS